MPHAPRSDGQFKRQIVFRISPDDWPLLEHAAREHGSIQAAVIAGLRALKDVEPLEGEPSDAGAGDSAPTNVADGTDGTDEMRARDAARMLGLKTGTVSGYIRTGRLPGRNDGSRWITTRSAVASYKKRVQMRD